MRIGDLIDDKYHVIQEIGEGGMGRVYNVKKEEENFALKICLENDEENIKRFKREVRLMAEVKHQNVIEVIDFNFERDNPYFVMPLCKYSVDKILDKLQENHEIAIKIMLEVCSGINALHISGITHRDIKPKNILIDKNNNVKVSDLGLGKFNERDSTILTCSDVYMGTQGFIPPEFLKLGGTKNANAKSDIYQLGKTIYNIFSNSSPSLIERDKLPGGLLYIVKKCIADNQEERYKSVGELTNALNNYMKSLNPVSNPINAYENLINIAKDLLKSKTYDKENVEEIINKLFYFKNEPEIFFNKFSELKFQSGFAA